MINNFLELEEYEYLNIQGGGIVFDSVKHVGSVVVSAVTGTIGSIASSISSGFRDGYKQGVEDMNKLYSLIPHKRH